MPDPINPTRASKAPSNKLKIPIRVKKSPEPGEVLTIIRGRPRAAAPKPAARSHQGR
jgi:hypothetical protein